MPDDPRTVADVVIVGAGTAGCVLATVLSADPGRRVALIEAGPPQPDPALAGVDYLERAAPDRFWTTDLVERVAGQPPQPWRSGRGIGGSAAVNGMVAVPPSAAELATWQGLGPGWSTAAIHRAQAVVSRGWTPTTPAEFGPLERALAAAAASTGRGTFAPLALERVDGRRAGVADRLLRPVLDRANLTFVGDTSVAGVALDGGRAAGVVLGDGAVIEAAEVVLAAGAIRSPLLLAASGLGDRLAGGRLADHPSGTFTLHLREELDASLQTCGALRWSTPTGAVAEVLPIARVGEQLGAVTLALMDPVATGTVLAEPQPDGVVARLGLLAAERDREAMREAIAGALDLFATPPFTALVERVSAGALAIPAEELRDAPDALLDTWVDTTGPLVHAACSLPLGTVLDARGAVPGVGRLRVVDASALPALPGGGPNASVAVLAATLAASWDDR